MALPISGPISFGDINIELGRLQNTTISLNELLVRELGGVISGSISMSAFYGKAAVDTAMTLIYDTSLGDGTPTIGVNLNGTVDVIINWGDGTLEQVTTAGYKTHTYEEGGTYEVKISGSLTQFGGITDTHAAKLTECTTFGEIGLSSLQYAFYNAINLIAVPNDLPFNVTDTSYMFWGAALFNDDISSWDTSGISTMEGMFFNAASFNQPINAWNTINVSDMSYMFYGAVDFNQPLDLWNTSNVTNMAFMFFNAISFNQSLATWDVSNVTDMSGMFSFAESFNQPLSSWDTGNATSMDEMFSFALSFDQDISTWCVENIPNEPAGFGENSLLGVLTKPIWGACPGPTEQGMIFTVDTSIPPGPGGIPGATYSIRLFLLDNVNCIIDWGDGNQETVTTVTTDAGGGVSHTYADSNIYRIRITGIVSTFNGFDSRSAPRVINCISFGNLNTVRLLSAFYNCSNLVAVPNNIPFSVTSIANMFYNTPFNQDISNWDVSNVQDMSGMFGDTSAFNQPIGNWDVSSAKNMNSMFWGASAFNQPIGNWDVSSVENMGSMFSDTSAFNQDISNWDVSSVENMGGMFSDTSAFNQDISNWDVSSATYMGYMFYNTPFNQDISNWDVSNVQDMSYMFYNTPFNQPIGNWDVSSVETMSGMFWGASAFNQPIGNWDVSSVENMSLMFRDASAFNQPIGNWDVSSVETMSGMFWGASAFNQDLSTWNASRINSVPFNFSTESPLILQYYPNFAVFTKTISSNQTNFNLYNWAINNGWDGISEAAITVDSGVVISNDGPSQPDGSGFYAFYIGGSWPNGLELINNGIISGHGGQGGGGGSVNESTYGGTWTVSTGAGGGGGWAALLVESSNVSIRNNGTIRGGGGGGGGGGGASTVLTIEFFARYFASGGGGGGGQSGLTNVSGGSKGSLSYDTVITPSIGFGGNGGAGTIGGRGQGGAGGNTSLAVAGSGGNGGNAGASGSTGGGTYLLEQGMQIAKLNQPGGPGGAAGAAVVGNNLINWLATGTRIGPIQA
jgi:surface protein